MAKPIGFDKILETLKALTEKVDVGYDEMSTLQFEAKTEDGRSLAKADKNRYGYISNILWELIYQLEEWQQI